MGVKRSIVDLAIVLLTGIGIWLILRGNTYIGVAFIIAAMVLSFWRGLGYKLLKFLGL